MNTFAEYLNTMTVKTLNTIARDMGLKGYSKLRKAELVIMLDNAIAALVPVILSTEVATDVPAIVKIMAAAEVAPVKAAQSHATAVKVATPTATTDNLRSYATDALIAAYRGYRATALKMGNTPSRIKIVIKAREIAVILKSRKVNMRTV